MPRGSGVDSQQLRYCLPGFLVLTGLRKVKASLNTSEKVSTPLAILDVRHLERVLIVAFSSGHTVQT